MHDQEDGFGDSCHGARRRKYLVMQLDTIMLWDCCRLYLTIQKGKKASGSWRVFSMAVLRIWIQCRQQWVAHMA